MRDSRAVSEVIGFAIVFAIIILSVVMVSVAGFQGLDASRDAERVNNAQRGLDIFADNVDDVTRGGVPSRTTELRVSDADVALDEATTITVSVTPTGGGTTRTAPLVDRTLVYDAGTDSTVVYASGAVLRSDRNGAVLIRDPGFLVSENETVVTLVQLRPADSSGVGGSGTVHLRVTGDESTVITGTTPHDVTVTVSSPDVAAWERYFESLATDAPTMTCQPVGTDTVSCSWTTDRVYVTHVDAELRFD